MFPAQRGLYDQLSTMNHFAKPGHQFMNFDPFPFTNANLMELTTGNKSPLLQHCPSSGDDFYEHDLSGKEDNNMSIKKPLSKAERRAEHNAIERARRESLNTKFQSLAQALPNLMNYRRPSKSQIVEKALDWVKQSLSREERYRYQILQLQRENKRMLGQLMSQTHQEIPVPKHSVSTPTVSNFSKNEININASNTSPITKPHTSASLAMAYNTSPNPHMYSDEYIDTNGWPNTSHIMHNFPEIPSYPSQEELSNQEFNSRSEDDEILSSGNEDEADYRSSPYKPASAYNDLSSSPIIKNFDYQQHILTPDLFSIPGYPSASETRPNSLSASNNWGHLKNSPHNMSEGVVDSGSNNMSSMRLIS